MERDRHNNSQGINCIPPEALAADTNGAVIDTALIGSLEYFIHVGTAFVGGGFDVTLEESDVVTFGGEETAVPADETLGPLPQIAITDADTVFRVGSVGKKRYQRIVLTETDTITAGVIGVLAVAQDYRHNPQPAQAT